MLTWDVRTTRSEGLLSAQYNHHEQAWIGSITYGRFPTGVQGGTSCQPQCITLHPGMQDTLVNDYRRLRNSMSTIEDVMIVIMCCGCYLQNYKGNVKRCVAMLDSFVSCAALGRPTGNWAVTVVWSCNLVVTPTAGKLFQIVGRNIRLGSNSRFGESSRTKKLEFNCLLLSSARS